VSSKLLQGLIEFIKNKLGPGSTVYTIFRPCRRCVYQKSHEPILIFSKTRGPRIIIFPNKAVYVRTGECVGFKKCGRCFEAISDPNFPCKWKKI